MRHIVQHEYGVGADRGDQKLVTLHRVQYVRRRETIPHRIRHGKDDELAVPNKPKQDGIAVTARAFFQKLQGRLRIAKQPPCGRRLQTGGK